MLQPPISKRTTTVFSICIIVFVLAAILAISNAPSGIETSVFHWFNNGSSTITSIAKVVTEAGSLPHSFLLWALAAFFIGGRLAAAQLLVGGLGAAAVCQIAKETIARGRPEALFEQLHLYVGASDGYGFPSGHSTFAAVCATILFFYVKKPIYRAGLVLLAITIGLSRMYLGPHLPLDVVGGWALGTACGIAVISGWRYMPARFQFT